jgi:hypothetical protein
MRLHIELPKDLQMLLGKKRTSAARMSGYVRLHIELSKDIK